MPVGSYGLPVRCRANGEIFLLTAAHVVGSLSWAHGLDRPDVSLAVNSGVPGSGDPIIGEVVASHPAEPGQEIELDSSLITPRSGVMLGDVARIECFSGIAWDVEQPSAEDDLVVVHKRGVHGLTEGLLEPFATSVVLESQQPDGSSVLRNYPRVFVVYGAGSRFAKPGDSGSVVIDDDDCVVGMLVGLLDRDDHDDPPAVVVPIVDVLEKLDLELTGPQRPCTLV